MGHQIPSIPHGVCTLLIGEDEYNIWLVGYLPSPSECSDESEIFDIIYIY
jgi:hypothetical protein